jgi:hypothetical protein
MSFESFRKLLDWKEINNCPGRFVLRKRVSHADFNVEQLLRKFFPRASIAPNVVRLKRLGPKQDAVDVCLFEDGGGIISFVKANENRHYVHTLNTNSGMERKLRGLGCARVFDETTRRFRLVDQND